MINEGLSKIWKCGSNLANANAECYYNIIQSLYTFVSQMNLHFHSWYYLIVFAMSLVRLNALKIVNLRWTKVSHCARHLSYAEPSTQPNGERFNKLIDLSSSKVVNNISLAPGEKCVVCRCWKSAKFPLCDGSHAKHNKETGDNLGPAIISVPK